MKMIRNRFSDTALRVGALATISYALNYSFQLVDIFWVARIGLGASTAIAVVSCILFLIFSANEIIGVGSLAMFSQSFGAKKLDQLSRIILQTLLLKLAVGVVTILLFPVAIFIALRYYGLTPIEMTYVREYASIIWVVLILLPFVTTLMTALRTTGQAVAPTVISILALVINAVLNPVLIFGWGSIPAMGVAGAAWATLVAEGFGVVVGVILLARNQVGLKVFRGRNFGWAPDLYWPLLTIGLPAAGVVVLYNSELAFLTALVASFPSAVSDGFGIGARIYGFLFFINVGLSLGVSVAVGQAIGAKDPKAVWDGITWVIAVILGALTLMSAALILLAPIIVSGFTLNPQSIDAAVTYLRFMAVANIGLGLMWMFIGVFEGAGRNGPSLRATTVMYLMFEFPVLVLLWISGAYNLYLIWIIVSITAWFGAFLIWRQFHAGSWASGLGDRLET